MLHDDALPDGATGVLTCVGLVQRVVDVAPGSGEVVEIHHRYRPAPSPSPSPTRRGSTSAWNTDCPTAVSVARAALSQTFEASYSDSGFSCIDFGGTATQAQVRISECGPALVDRVHAEQLTAVGDGESVPRW